jgi:hypothetical protein
MCSALFIYQQLLSHNFLDENWVTTNEGDQSEVVELANHIIFFIAVSACAIYPPICIVIALA